MNGNEETAREGGWVEMLKAVWRVDEQPLKAEKTPAETHFQNIYSGDHTDASRIPPRRERG